MDVRHHNREAWNREVSRQSPWTIPADPEAIAEARRGRPSIVLTPQRPVPLDWLGPLRGQRVLCLASGGGQQGPVLAAAGAEVTVLDNSPAQLERDQQVAAREGLSVRVVEGDMRDLSVFVPESFDLIVHPVSNVFVPDIRPVWRECARVLRTGGALLAGFCLPCLFIFDEQEQDAGRLVVRHRIPYSELDEDKREARIAKGEPLEFGHTLEDQIGGQLDAGLVLTGFYDDRDSRWPIGQYLPTFAATRALKADAAG